MQVDLSFDGQCSDLFLGTLPDLLNGVLIKLLKRVEILRDYQNHITLVARSLLSEGHFWPVELSVHISKFISLPDLTSSWKDRGDNMLESVSLNESEDKIVQDVFRRFEITYSHLYGQDRKSVV